MTGIGGQCYHADMKHAELIAQLNGEIEATRKSLAFWDAQPDLDIGRFSVAKYRQTLKVAITENEQAMAVLTGESSA